LGAVGVDLKKAAYRKRAAGNALAQSGAFREEGTTGIVHESKE